MHASWPVLLLKDRLGQRPQMKDWIGERGGMRRLLRRREQGQSRKPLTPGICLPKCNQRRHTLHGELYWSQRFSNLNPVLSSFAFCSSLICPKLFLACGVTNVFLYTCRWRWHHFPKSWSWLPKSVFSSTLVFPCFFLYAARA